MLKYYFLFCCYEYLFFAVLKYNTGVEEAILCVSNLDQVVYDLEGVLIVFDEGDLK